MGVTLMLSIIAISLKLQSSDQMFPFSGAFVAILVTSVVLILPAEVQTAVNKESEEEEQKMEVGLQIIQQNFA